MASHLSRTDAGPDANPARAGYTDQSRRIARIALCAVAVGVVLAFSRSLWAGSWMESVLGALGQCLLMAAVLGRLWATLYIGGRKNARLVTGGPYSMSRNPLYFFSTLGAVGAGLAFGSVVAGLALGGATYSLLERAARQEAAHLRASFGTSYADYAQAVPLIWPSLTAYEEAGEPTFQPRALGRALRDSCLFLLVMPAAELVSHAKSVGAVPSLVPLF